MTLRKNDSATREIAKKGGSKAKPKGTASPKWTQIKRNCAYCGRLFWAYPKAIEKGRSKFCSISCSAKAQPREKQALSQVKRIKIQCQNCGKEFVARPCDRRAFCSRHCASQSRQIKLWKNQDYRTKIVTSIVKSQHRKPNVPERKLQDILDKHFPNEWKYTGDGTLIIEGFNPDFANVNGKKKLIEVFGDYWHSSRVAQSWHKSELGRMMAYSSLGYDCLVIWECEINSLSEREIASKIKKFSRKGKCRGK